MPLALVTDAGLGLYARFNDAGNRAVAMTEGAGLKGGVYTAADATIAASGLPAGNYVVRFHFGSSTAQNSSDPIYGVATLIWKLNRAMPPRASFR